MQNHKADKKNRFLSQEIDHLNEIKANQQQLINIMVQETDSETKILFLIKYMYFCHCILQLKLLILMIIIITTYMKQQEQLLYITQVKATRISHYPYYPIADNVTIGSMHYLIRVNFSVEERSLSVIGFRSNGQKFVPTSFSLENLPRKPLSLVKIIDLVAEPKKNTTSVKSGVLLFGFRSGHLLKIQLLNNQVKILEKYNQTIEKEGMMTKLTSRIFSNDDFYKPWVQSPVRIIDHYSTSPKYKTITMIGNMLTLHKQLTSARDMDIQQTYKQIPWDQLQMKTKHKFGKIVMQKNQKQKIMMCQEWIVLNSTLQICSVLYKSEEGMMIVGYGEGDVVVFAVDSMVRLAVYRFDIEIKRICDVGNFLIVMPYENTLYLIDMDRKITCKFIGHKSFITNATIVDGFIITGGCDHRISFHNMKNIQWQELSSQKKVLMVNTSCDGRKFDTMYTLGKYHNDRDNEYDYGFGNFLQLNPSLYAFLTYDFIVKIFKVKP